MHPPDCASHRINDTHCPERQEFKRAAMADYQEDYTKHHFPPRHLCGKEQECSCQSAPNDPCRRTGPAPRMKGSAARARGSTAELRVMRENSSTWLIPWGRWAEYKEIEASSGLAATQMCWRMLGSVDCVSNYSDSNVKASWDMLSHGASSHHCHQRTIHNFWILSQIQGTEVSKGNGDSFNKSFIKIFFSYECQTWHTSYKEFEKKHNWISGVNELPNAILAAGIFVATGVLAQTTLRRIFW